MEGLVDTRRQERNVQDELRGATLTHLGLACAWGAMAEDAPLVADAARQWWNAAVPFISDAVTRKLLFRTACDIAGHLAAVGETDAMHFRVMLYQLIFDCHSDAEDWEGGLEAVHRAFNDIPRHLQRPLWTSRVVFSSKLGKSVAEGLAKVKESDPTLQARSWATLARSSSRPKDQLVAYLRVLDTLEGR